MTLEVCDILEEPIAELPAGTIIIVTPGPDVAADKLEDAADFFTGVASATTSLTIEGEGEMGVAG